MSELTAKELKEKIAMVEKDLQRLQASGADIRQISVLTDYKDYLKEQLLLAENFNKDLQKPK